MRSIAAVVSPVFENSRRVSFSMAACTGDPDRVFLLIEHLGGLLAELEGVLEFLLLQRILRRGLQAFRLERIEPLDPGRRRQADAANF